MGGISWLQGRQSSQLTIVVFTGLVARLMVFRDVAVNGDTGLYLYDAKQLLWGKQLMVEYPSRSPVFEYTLAAAVKLGESPIIAGRTTMLIIGLLLGIAIYAFTRQLHSHRAGLLAALLFYLTPFSLVWGLWVKTEQAAGLVLVSAFTVALTQIDRKEINPAWLAVVGGLFGVAFLIRRVAIVHIGAFALFVIYYRYRWHGEHRQTVGYAAVVLAAAAVILGIAYLLLARFDPATWLEFWRQHLVALFSSRGQGSIGYLPIDRPRAVTAESRGGLATICQKCGLNTVSVFARTLMVTAPVSVPLIIYWRSWTESVAPFVSRVVIPVTLGITGLLALLRVTLMLQLPRILFVLGLLVGVVAIWWFDPVDWGELWNRRLALPAAVLVALAAGYLYRDRILYVTYFQDFYPYVVALAAIAIVVTAKTVRPIGWQKIAVVALAGGLLLTGAGMNAYPYQPQGVDPGVKWFTVDNVQAYGDDIEARTEPGDRIFVAQPLYVVDADRRIVADLSRTYYLFRGWPDSPVTSRAEQRVISDLDSASYAVYDGELQVVLNRTVINESFKDSFCAVDAPMYQHTGGQLYKRCSK